MTDSAFWSRRGVLQGLGAGVTVAATGLRRVARAQDSYDHVSAIEERLAAFYNETDVRPQYVWVNREDVMYHDMDFPAEVAAAPEHCAFVNSPVWVFNRATRWLRDSNTILCYDEGGDLFLTGAHQASSWHSGPANTLASDGDFTVFDKRSQRRRDAAVLPAFQFRQDQHPVLEFTVLEANTDWQLCVTLKGRGGRPLIASAWHAGPSTLTINLVEELAARGFHWSYPEMHFAIGTWNTNPEHPSRVKFRAALKPQGAIAGCLPVIRTQKNAHDGAPLTAIVLDAKGARIGRGEVRVVAYVADRATDLSEADGVWRGRLQDLGVGDHVVRIRSEGAVQAETRCEVRITDGEFLGFTPEQAWVTRRGEPVGPLTGSYQGTWFFRNAGRAGESMVQGQREWDAWDRSEADSEHMHFWESLTEDELDTRFRFLASAGFDLTTLHSHWGDWERLDAGGQIAPHGAEQLARYLRVAGRHGLAHVQALASGPYATSKVAYGGTVPYSRYLEAGFKSEQFMTPGSSAFEEMYHQYLKDFALLFADDTALFAMTSAGEGDHFVGPSRTNDTMRTIRAIDRNHVFLAETVNVMRKLPQEHSRGFDEDRFGSRTYFIGNHYAPEADLGVHFKMLNLAGLYLAEGSWPPMPSYVRFHYEVLRDNNGSPKCWTGTEHYRRRLRDTLYLGLVHLIPIMNTWDEVCTEDEHVVFREIRGLVNWKQQFAHPKLAIRVDNTSANIDDPGYGRLAQLEAALATLGLASRYVAANSASNSADIVLEGSTKVEDLRFHADGGVLPDAWRRSLPLLVSEGYSVSHVASADERTFLAYVYNTTRHERQYYWLGGHYHRAPVAAALKLTVRRPAKSPQRVRIYDLNSRALMAESAFAESAGFDFGATANDFFVLVTPS